AGHVPLAQARRDRVDDPPPRRDLPARGAPPPGALPDHVHALCRRVRRRARDRRVHRGGQGEDPDAAPPPRGARPLLHDPAPAGAHAQARAQARRGHGRGRRVTPLLRLSRLQFWSIFAIGVAIFLFSTGPVWRHPWQFSALNLAILYSYLPLPFLVAAGLAYKKRLSLRAFFLDTLEITLLKYSVTFGIALVLWGFLPAPPPEAGIPHAARPRASASEEPPAPPTPIAEEQTGAINGAVVDGAGAPMGGALVYIAGGLEGIVFAAPEAKVELE